MSPTANPTRGPWSEEQAPKLSSPWAQIWRRFRKHRLAMLSAGLVGLLLVVALGRIFLLPEALGRVQQRLPAYLHSPSVGSTKDSSSLMSWGSQASEIQRPCSGSLRWIPMTGSQSAFW